MPEPHAYTRQETAEILHVSTRTVDRLVAAGELASAVVAGRRLFPVDAVHRLLVPGTTTSTTARRAAAS
jgi:excisionase family DNA binding protein